MKYRINARWTEQAFLEVEAASADEALKIAEDTPMSDFWMTGMENTTYDVEPLLGEGE